MSPLARSLKAHYLAIPHDVRVVLVAGLLVVSGFTAVLFVIAPEGAEAGLATSAVAAKSTGGRLLLGIDQVAVGSTVQEGDSERTMWAGLHRAEGRADIIPEGLTSLGSGPVSIDPINEVRLKLRSAGIVKEGILHELVLPHDTLRVRIPGEPGRPGDTLVITFDVGKSISDENGLLVFRPYLSEAHWVKPPTVKETAALDPAAGNKTTPVVAPQAWEYDTPGGGAPVGSGSGAPGQQASLGRMTVRVHDEIHLRVDSLDTTFTKVGVKSETGGLQTYFEGSRQIDLRAHEGRDDAAHLVTFQLPAGTYDELHIGFGSAQGQINGIDQALHVPLPHLVIEHPFEIKVGERLEVALDFSIPQSLMVSGEGLELRPFVVEYWDSDREEEATQTPRPLPAPPRQYLTGGQVLPSIGQTNAFYVQSLTGRDLNEDISGIDEEVTGGEQRPVHPDGGLVDIGTGADPTDPGTVFYLVQSLSMGFMPSAQTLAPLGVTEVSRLDHLPVMVVSGPPGREADLLALPGVIHVSQDVALASFP